MTADLVTVAACVAVIAAVWYVLGRVEARLLRTGARHPAQDDGPRLLPVWYLPADEADPIPEDVRRIVLDACREHDAGLGPIPDGFIEVGRGGVR